MNNTKMTRAQRQKIERALQRHDNATRKEIEQRMFDVGLSGGQQAILDQARGLRRFRMGFENNPEASNLINMLDWGLECLWRQHPSYSAAFNEFVQSV